MKKLLMAAFLVSAASGAMAQNIDIDLGGSGYYGRIDLGNLSRPPVIYQQPMIIERSADYRRMEPTYLRVPPGHAKKWSKHCARYDACGRPVYFVQDSWYSNTYAPRYRQTREGRRDDDRGYRADDRRDGDKNYAKAREKDYKEYHKEQGKKDKHNKHDDDHGKGHGKGNGKH